MGHIGISISKLSVRTERCTRYIAGFPLGNGRRGYISVRTIESNNVAGSDLRLHCKKQAVFSDEEVVYLPYHPQRRHRTPLLLVRPGDLDNSSMEFIKERVGGPNATGNVFVFFGYAAVSSSYNEFISMIEI